MAHALWTLPKPRDKQDGYKPPPRNPGFVLPCGVARSATQPVNPLTAGMPMKVQSTGAHPGCFLIEYARSDKDVFQRLTIYKHPDTTREPQPYETMITLPDEECTGCVLRIRQVMLANNNAVCPPAGTSGPLLFVREHHAGKGRRG